jgi:hypothetical protein
MRWGNWDVVTQGSRFLASEVPSGITTFANPVPSGQTLPASFFLNSKPDFWAASKPWPGIGPDVTGGNIPDVGGHAYTIPAQDCYRLVMGGPSDGSGAALSFNADTCYSLASSGVPSAPTNLRIVH